jgi:hypothetical protein
LSRRHHLLIPGRESSAKILIRAARNLYTESVSKHIVELPVKQAEIGILVFVNFTEVVPLAYERPGEEIPVRANAPFPPEPPVELTEEVFEPVKGSRFVLIIVIVLRPEGIEKHTWQYRELRIDAVFKSEYPSRMTAPRLPAPDEQLIFCLALPSKPHHRAASIVLMGGPEVTELGNELFAAEKRVYVAKEHSVHVYAYSAVLEENYMAKKI